MSKEEPKTEVKEEKFVDQINKVLESPSKPSFESPPKKINTTPKSNPRSGSNKGHEFFCDLCQNMIRFQSRTIHFVINHFDAKLKAILPNSEPFLCPMCNFVAKDFTKLSTHYLNKHDFLEEWISEAFEVMELEAMANIEQSFALKINEQDLMEDPHDKIEEIEEPQTNFKSMISDLYVQEPPSKKRKISRSVNERGLEAVKDFIAPIDPMVSKYNKVYTQSYRTSRNPIPIRIMASTVTSNLYHQVPHDYVSHGKLLILTDPSHPGNLKLFQDQWVRGHPVIVSNVHKRLDMSLWRPEAFSNEFGHILHDVVNTKTGKIVPQVPLKKFWDGFENLSLRMTDESGLPMLLKLKDWPPDNDLAHTLPSRFQDLMKCIPLGEYTKREGRYNLASFMPDFFARPDLGKKRFDEKTSNRIFDFLQKKIRQ